MTYAERKMRANVGERRCCVGACMRGKRSGRCGKVGLFVFKSWTVREEAGVEVVVEFNKSMAVDELIRVIIKPFAEFVMNFAGFLVGAFG